jgi:hypothetical protein
MYKKVNGDIWIIKNLDKIFNGLYRAEQSRNKDSSGYC